MNRSSSATAGPRTMVRGADTATAPHAIAPIDAGDPIAAALADAGRPSNASFILGTSAGTGGDRGVLQRMCETEIEAIERNRGGTTLSFRVRLVGGARALFKPAQQRRVANPRAEIAAYRFSRLLGLHRVPPACGRLMPIAELHRVADESGDAVFAERAHLELTPREDGNIEGALLAWVPGPLDRVQGTERWAELLDPSRALAPSDAPLAWELSQVIVFDSLIDNVDRWAGWNILQQHVPGHDPGPMLFMDNGASFDLGFTEWDYRRREQAARLQATGRHSRALISALRRLTRARIVRALRDDVLAPLLTEEQLDAVMHRRELILAGVDTRIRAHGEAAVMVFP